MPLKPASHSTLTEVCETADTAILSGGSGIPGKKLV